MTDPFPHLKIDSGGQIADEFLIFGVPLRLFGHNGQSGRVDLVLLPDRFFFFNVTATTDIYTLSLHDALPILRPCSTAKTIVAKLSSDRIIRPAFLATSVPEPMAIPMSAALMAGASLTPSPVMATT